MTVAGKKVHGSSSQAATEIPRINHNNPLPKVLGSFTTKYHHTQL